MRERSEAADPYWNGCQPFFSRSGARFNRHWLLNGESHDQKFSRKSPLLGLTSNRPNIKQVTGSPEDEGLMFLLVSRGPKLMVFDDHNNIGPVGFGNWSDAADSASVALT